MRKFRDREGRGWDVVLGRESWGALLALFIPERSDVPARQAMLRASAYDAAMQELDELDDGALQELLERSVVKDGGQG
jgi:hypothetical protein